MAFPVVAAAFMAAGTVTKIFGGLSAGKSAKRRARYNAALARRAAIDARRRSDVDEVKIRMQQAALQATQAAAAAGSNTVVSAGDNARLVADTAAFGQDNINVRRANAQREALGLEARATSLIMEGDAVRKASYYSAVGEGLSGAGSIIALRGK